MFTKKINAQDIKEAGTRKRIRNRRRETKGERKINFCGDAATEEIGITIVFVCV